jgi:vacuolar-type H+-ATPase subunit C/Vma6
MEEAAADKGGGFGAKDVMHDTFSEKSIEVVRNVLYKAYLEDFYA